MADVKLAVPDRIQRRDVEGAGARGCRREFSELYLCKDTAFSLPGRVVLPKPPENAKLW